MAVRTRVKPSQRVINRSNWLAVLSLSLSVIVATVIVLRVDVPKRESLESVSVVGGFDMVKIPVPRDFIPAGTKVQDISLRFLPFAVHQVPEEALRDVSLYLDAVTATALPANLPLFAENLLQEEGISNAVIDRIPEGMRAMTIRVDATSAVEGWASSGSVVDVLLVNQDGTNVIAEKVKVLSAERSVSPMGPQGSPDVPSTVTLLVTQEQCLAINTAIPLGKIAFALRSMKDRGFWSQTGFSPKRLGRKAALSDERSQVKGYAAIRREGESLRTFALLGREWTPIDKPPASFINPSSF